MSTGFHQFDAVTGVRSSRKRGHTVTKHMKCIGRHPYFWATCDECGGAWIKNSWGQFVWTRRGNRDVQVKKHERECHGRSIKAA
jgi:hypothetical protein